MELFNRLRRGTTRVVDSEQESWGAATRTERATQRQSWSHRNHPSLQTQSLHRRGCASARTRARTLRRHRKFHVKSSPSTACTEGEFAFLFSPSTSVTKAETSAVVQNTGDPSERSAHFGRSQTPMCVRSAPHTRGTLEQACLRNYNREGRRGGGGLRLAGRSACRA